MAFSPTESAFEGFRLARRSPLTIVIWALFFVVMTAGILWLVGGGSMANFMEVAEDFERAGDAPTPEQVGEFLNAYFAFVGPIIPIGVVFGAVITAAVNRAIVRPSESAFGYLRLGMDEVRVFVVRLVLGIIIGLACAIPAVIGAIALGVAGMALQDNPGLIFLVAVLFALAFIAFVIWLSVRFSLAMPITVAERRFAFFDSWSLTRGHVWGLIGMAILAWVLGLVVQILLSIVILPILFFVSGGFDSLMALQDMTPMEIAREMTPLAITILAFAAIVSALETAIMYTPFASAYVGLTGRDRAETAVPADPDPMAG